VPALSDIGRIDSLRVVILVDNRRVSSEVLSTWGLSIYIDTGVAKILFDTDSSWNILKYNAEVLGVPLEDLDFIFISHWHGDHSGGLSGLISHVKRFGRNVEVVVPSKPLFGGEFFIVARRPVKLCDGVVTTGVLGWFVREHSLIVNVDGCGPVVFVGCAHPGIPSILRRAADVTGSTTIYGVVGGYHIDAEEANRVADVLERFNVRIVAPCHCISNSAINVLSELLGERSVRTFTGKCILIGNDFHEPSSTSNIDAGGCYIRF